MTPVAASAYPSSELEPVRLFPRQIDNNYRGHRLGLWLLAAVLLVKTGMSMGVMFNGYNAALRADGIPLNTFPPSAAQAVVAIFGVWGVTLFSLCLVGVLALVRYRTMAPLVLSLLLLEQLGRKLVLSFIPMAKTGTSPGFYVNLALLALMTGALVLSLWPKRGSPAAH
jgi:hypothetical protein